MNTPTDGPTVHWGVLGTGSVAASFARGLSFVPGSQLGAVGSRTKSSADSFAARFGGVRAYAGYEQLLADPAIDVVYVATPNETHKHYSLLALDAGKAVFCEKPLALDAEEGRAIVEAARQRRLFCAEAMWMRFSPAVRQALQMARQGVIGDIRILSAQLGYPNAVDPGSRLFRLPGGGALLDLAVYPLSLAQAIFGRPVRVSSAAIVGPTGVDEQLSIILDYPGGRQAVMAASLRAQLSNSATISGTSGVINILPPLVFPDRFRVTKTDLLDATKPRSPGPLAQVRTWPIVGTIVDHPQVQALARHRDHFRSRSVVLHDKHNGYSTEAAEVTRCLRSGLLECPSMPLDDTLAVLGSMDAVRAQWAATA